MGATDCVSGSKGSRFSIRGLVNCIVAVDLRFMVRLETSDPNLSISWALRHFACRHRLEFGKDH